MMKKTIVLVACLCMSSLACSAEASIIILMDVQEDKQTMFLDGNSVKKENLYASLAGLLANKGRNNKVDVLFNPNLPFAEVENMKGLLQAVGFLNIKFYSLSNDKRKMAEIEMNKPAITSPPLKINK